MTVASWREVGVDAASGFTGSALGQEADDV